MANGLPERLFAFDHRLIAGLRLRDDRRIDICWVSNKQFRLAQVIDSDHDA